MSCCLNSLWCKNILLGYPGRRTSGVGCAMSSRKVEKSNPGRRRRPDVAGGDGRVESPSFPDSLSPYYIWGHFQKFVYHWWWKIFLLRSMAMGALGFSSPAFGVLLQGQTGLKFPHPSDAGQTLAKSGRKPPETYSVSGGMKMVSPDLLAVFCCVSPAVTRGLVQRSICRKGRQGGLASSLMPWNVKRQ